LRCELLARRELSEGALLWWWLCACVLACVSKLAGWLPLWVARWGERSAAHREGAVVCPITDLNFDFWRLRVKF
jgi:hypothetical protein